MYAEVRQRIVSADSETAPGCRPPTDPHTEAWVRHGDANSLHKGGRYTARLTLDIPPALRARIKITAFTRGVTVAELLRVLLEREFPETPQ
nr:chromosome partitioning protein ParB [Klebsiella variicola]